VKATTRPSKTSIYNHPLARQPSAGPDGLSVVPPAYGIESLDRALPQGGPGDVGQPAPEGKTPPPGASLQLRTMESAWGGDAGFEPPHAPTGGVEALFGPSADKGQRLTNEAWHVIQQKRVKPTIPPANPTTGCSCHTCQGGGSHVPQSALSPANLVQTRQVQEQTGSPIHGPAPIQRMALPNGDPNAGITAILTAIETAAANPAHQTVNNANDVVGAPQAPNLPNPGAQETYGLARYNNGLFALGSQAFANAAGATRLGARAPREHAEMSFIINQGAPNSVWTTQDCCLFCFGYLDTQGIPHLPLRAHPFPQAWTHPTQGWQIVRRTPFGNRPYWRISAPNGAMANYLLVAQDAPKTPSKNKRKRVGDGDGASKKNSNNKKTVGSDPVKKKIRV